MMQYLVEKLKRVEGRRDIDTEILEGEMLHLVGTFETLMRR